MYILKKWKRDLQNELNEARIAGDPYGFGRVAMLEMCIKDLEDDDENLTVNAIDVEIAVNKACSCGGAGPEDGACPACMMYHYLTRRSENESV